VTTPPKKPTRGLGRGLDALLPARPPPTKSEVATATGYGDGNVFRCAIDKLKPQAGQPRQHFDNERLEELAQSIREHGLLEPLVVRRQPGSGELEIVAGERRWRAAQRAGLHEVLVVVHDVSAKDAFELALVENVQREDLNAIEFAEALDRLIKEHGYTQETLAQRIGKDRSTIANALRLLRLPAAVRARVIAGELSEGHARALLGAPDDAKLAALAEKVVRGRLSVRQTEAMVRGARLQSGAKGGAKPGKTPATRDLEVRLQRKLGTKIEVRDKEGKGEIAIRYASWDELDRLLELLL
jgi:ParB family chromosome partitioning protein